MDATRALGAPDDAEAFGAAKRLAEVGLSEGLDRRYGGQLDEPDRDKGLKIWWVQAEALNTWSMMDHYQPASEQWATAFEEQWRFISDHLLDRKFGGWISQTTRRGRPAGPTAKSAEWLDPYHSGRALMNVTREWRPI
jgi:mannose/cellobiose epimerase-like protein (N-acyl-D-glucosamine 2-epimerase family)